MNGRMPTDAAARDLEAQITALLTARHAIARRSWRRRDNRCPAPGHRQINPERLRGDAALAALCGASPVEASSGKTSKHRLNRGGDRAARNALWVIAYVRTISDPRTRAFVAERTATGNSHREIMRMLQRYIVRGYTPSSSRPSAMTPSLV